MSSPRLQAHLRLTIFAAFCSAPLLHSQTLTWDANTGTTGAQNGLGTWNLTNTNWWDGTTNTTWTNSLTAIANIGVVGGTVASQDMISVAQDIQLKELNFRAISTASPATNHQYFINGDVAGRILDFGSNGLIQMEDFSSGGSQFVNLQGNIRLKGENLRIQKYGAGTSFQYLTLGMTQNPDLIGNLTIGGSIYATITAPGTLQSLSRVVVEAGGSAPLSGTNPNYTTAFSLAGFGNSLTNSGTSYGAIRFVSNNTTMSGGILLTADAGVHTNFSGANGTTGIVINSPITDGGNNFAFHRFAFTRGNGTLTLSAANTYGGATVLGRALSGGYSGGITILDFTAATAPQNNIIYNGLTGPGALSFIGGNSTSILRLTGKSGENHNQWFGNVTVNGTHSALELQPGFGGSLNMSIGTLTRTDKNATFSITGPSSGAITTTQPDGFLGAWSSYTDNNYSRSWAKVTGGVITSGFTGDVNFTTGESLSTAPYTTASNLGITSASTGPVTMGAGATQLDTVSMADYAKDRVIQISTGQTLRLGTLGGIQIVSGAGDLIVGETAGLGSLTSGGALNTAGPLFLSNHSATSLLTVNSNIVNNGSGATTLVVNGAPGSRTILTGTNAYTGGTQVSSGILEVRSNGALGTSGTVTVVDGATLALSGGVTISRALAAVGGFGDGNNGAIRSISGDNIITGSITQNAMFMMAADAGASLTIQPSSVITYSSMLTFGGAGTVTVNAALTGAGAITKAGTGLLVLGGNNTYTGATLVGTGTAKLGSATALGATSSVTIGAGGTLDMNGFSSDRGFLLNGTGIGSNGALINSSGTPSNITGTINLSTASVIGGSGNIMINNAGGLTGNILLTKVGAGTLTIASTAASARSGTTQIDAGTLRLQAATVLATAGTGAIALNGGTLSLGFNATGSLTSTVNVLNSSTIIADRATAGDGGTVLTLGAVTIGGGTLTVKAGDNVSNGTIGLTLGAVGIGGPAMLPGNPTFDVQSTAAAATTLTLGSLSDQGISPRTLTFQNSGTAASATTLGTAATSLVNGTIVNLASTGGATTLNLNIAGALGTLAQVNVGSGNTLSLGAAQTIGSLAGSGTVSASAAYTLTIGNAINSTVYDTAFSGVLANGAGGTGVLTVIKAGRSTLTLSGTSSNTLTGLTTVNAGTLILAKTGGATAVSSLTIGGSASGTAGNATVRLMGSNQMASTGTLLINAGGTLDLNGYDQTVTLFSTLLGGKIIGTGSTLVVAGTSGTITGSGVSSIETNYQITGAVAATRTMSITSSTDIVTINGRVTEGSAAGTLTKTGSGTLVLTGNNTYTGVTTVSTGILNIQHANALGSIANRTTVSTGATLQIQGGITTSTESLTINGAGFVGSGGVGIQTGALVNVSGTNNYAGLLTLGAASTISSDSGTLNLTNTGTITGTNFSLTLTGAGDGRIDSIIGTAAGPVVKNGTGTWTLTGANTSNGMLIVENGTLQLGNGTSGSWTAAPAMMMSGTARFNYQGATTGSSQSLGTLTFSAGDGVVQSTYGGVSGDTSLTFSALATRTVGATGNFVVSGGSNGTTNKIVLTGQTAGSFINQGLYFGGSSYAWYDAGGFVRGLAYGSDAGTATSAGGTTLAGTAHQQITGAVTAQNTATFTTLKIAGNNNFALASGQTVTVNGILKSGDAAGGSTISGGTGIQAAVGAEMVIRTDGANDVLTISTPILANGSNALTKTGAGTLVLSGLNTYTGATNVAAGTLRLGNGGTLTTSSLNVRIGGTLDLNGQSITNAVAINGTGVGNAGALINNSGTASQVGAITLGSSSNIGGSGNTLSTGTLVGLSPIRMTKVGSGTVTFGNNAGTPLDSMRTGPNQIDAGVMRISNSSSAIGTSASQLILNGGTLSLGSASSVVAYPTAVTSSSGIITDVFTPGAGIIHTLGTLAMGSQTLTVTAGSNVTTAGTNAGVTFGATTFTGNPVFDIQSPTTATGGTTTLTLGALSDQAVAKTLTFKNTGSSTTNSQVTLATAAASLLDGTIVNLNSGPNAGVTMNLNVASTLGTFAQVTVSGQSILNLGAAQTLASLAGNGTVTSAGAFILTVGNANSTPLDTTFSGRLMDGTGALALTKSGLGTLTLTGSNTYTGATVVTAGILKLGSSSALGSTPTVTISVGGTIDLNGQSSDRNFSSISGTGHNGLGAIINTSSTTSVITGTSVQGAVTKIGGSGNITFSNTGGLTGSALLTKIGTGTLTFISTATSARSGTVQIDEGTFRVQAATAVNPVGTGPYALNGGTLSLGFDLANPMTNAVNLLSSSTIVVDRASAGAGSFGLNLGVLSVGNGTLTIKPGSNVTSGTMALTVGTTTIGSTTLLPGNPVFDVQSTATAAMTLTMGALSDQAIAPRTITFQNSGTAPSSVNLGIAATSLVDGTVVNLANTGAAITVNLNVANALGTFAQTTVGSGNTLALGASQTFASLNGAGTVTTSVPTVVTIGNVLSPTVSHSVFNGTFAGGSNLSVVKTGAGNLTLAGSSTFSGGLTVSGGNLILANGSGSATGAGSVSMLVGTTLAGDGRIQAGAGRSVSIFGNLSPGTTSTIAAQMDILTSGSGTLLLDGSSAVVFNIVDGLGQGDNTSDLESADLLRIGGTMTVMPGSTLRVQYDGIGTWAAGDQWRLFDWTSLTGSQVGNFTAYDLPTLSGDLSWDLSQLSSTGILSITGTIVPEPGRAALLALSCIGLLMRRRRAA